MSSRTCEACGRRPGYEFATEDGARHLRCTRHALVFPRVRDRAAQVALVVGTILFAINQLDVVLAGQLSPFVAAKIGLTFLVPYSVSTYSALAVNRLR